MIPATMVRRASVLVIVTAVAGLAGPGAACKRAEPRAEEKALEKAGGVQVDIDKVPDDFPGSIPVYPGAKIVLAAKSMRDPAKPAWALTLETGDSKDAVAAYYKQHMAGFTPASDLNMDETAMALWQSSAVDVTILIARQPDAKTGITIDATQK